MYAFNETYYHISDNTDNIWKVGNTLVVSPREFNHRYDELYKYSPRIWDNFWQLPGEKFCEYMTNGLNNSSNEIKKRIFKECIFEGVRRKEYSKLPSRLTSYWLCERESLEYWSACLLKDNSKKKIYKVKVEGTIYKTYHAYILWPFDTIYDLIKHAEHYWSGCGHYKEKTQGEILFNDGKITVLDEFNNLNDLKKATPKMNKERE